MITNAELMQYDLDDFMISEFMFNYLITRDTLFSLYSDLKIEQMITCDLLVEVHTKCWPEGGRCGCFEDHYFLKYEEVRVNEIETILDHLHDHTLQYQGETDIYEYPIMRF
jgi:hypothetical protein